MSLPLLNHTFNILSNNGVSASFSANSVICGSEFTAITETSSCLYQVLAFWVNIILLFVFICTFSYRVLVLKKASSSSMASQRPSMFSACFNGVLAMAYLAYSLWLFSYGKKWLLPLIQGLTWLILSLCISLKKPSLSNATTKFFSILAFLCGSFLCVSSIFKARAENSASIAMVFSVFYVPGGILLILSSFQAEDKISDDGDSYELLEDSDNVTPLATSGFLSAMSFWWLNPLMKKGKEKVLQEDDIPNLRREDRAETLYSMFVEQLSKKKLGDSSDPPSILSIIFACQRKPILISGIFALTKVLALASNPLFLAAFVNIVEGNSLFKYEGYALTIGLFFVKILESISERQWHFRARLIGLQVRSLLSAAIYKKQLKLSNAAKIEHSHGEIVNYVTVDAYRIGEFPFWLHQIWSTSLQLLLAIVIIYFSIGKATISALIVLVLTLLISSPLSKLQHKYQTRFTMAQNARLKKLSEALMSMKILKLYSWETHFKDVIERLRNDELKCIHDVLMQRNYYAITFFTSPLLVGVACFWTCYFLGIELYTINVFTLLATFRIIQEPIRMIPDVFGAFVEARVSFSRIVKFLEASELENRSLRVNDFISKEVDHSIFIRASEISWDISSRVTLRNIELTVQPGQKLAICGEVGSGKSTLLATILGEVPQVNGIVDVRGKIAYVSQSSWIQTGTIRDNILFGSAMEPAKYQETLEKCCLSKDIDILPFGDLTVIGERGVNLSGGQKQRVQLARALYQNADVYLLDDPFSAVDANTATSLFNEYVMGALSSKTVVLVTHQVDFLPSFNTILLMSGGEILKSAPYQELLSSSQDFQHLVNAHSNKNTYSKTLNGGVFVEKSTPRASEIQKVEEKEQLEEFRGDQLIKKEEREQGETGFKPYIQYLKHGHGFLFFSIVNLVFLLFLFGQLVQAYTFATKLQDTTVSRREIYAIYSVIVCGMVLALFFRSFFVTGLGVGASRSIFSSLLFSLFRAPMSFYDSTPVGRIFDRVSSDMNIIDLDVALKFIISCAASINTYTILGLLAFLAWPILFVIAPMICLIIILQNYFLRTAKELMRINGTTKSILASNLAETIAGAMTIRAFGEENRFFSKYLGLIDDNATTYFHNFSANEWLINRLETLCAIVLSAAALAITLLPLDASNSGFVGMVLSYGLSLNLFMVVSVQHQCMLANTIVSVERVEQYMHIPSEAPRVIQTNTPSPNWPAFGKVEIFNLKVRYRPNSPLVLHGISFTIEGGQKIGIVGRTGSGKTTLISVLFRLVEPTEGKIIVDGLDICSIGLHDLRSRFGIIPQDPTLFHGSVRFNLDPLSQHADHEIWEVLEKCQLREAIQDKNEGLNSLVVEEGTNWSMGQRQLFCLGRALLKRSRILVLDEATASMDNATDAILQRTIRREFSDSTVITVAHRIPTVMDCNKVIAISDGKLVEFDEPSKLMNKEGSLFGKFVNEYCSRAQ